MPEVRERAATPAGVRLLWAVCQIPDFRKTLTEAHLHLLATVFGHLADQGRLPTDWVADQVARLERTDGDIDALIARLAHIRTWTYVAHHADWLRDAAHWQERTRAVEDGLSDALHDRLTQRFVDRRTQMLLKGLHNGEELAAVEDDGAILVDGQVVGRVEGLSYVLEPGAADAERRALSTAARRVLVPELKRRTRALIGAADDAFALAERGLITWRYGGARNAAPVGRLLPGATALAPRLEVLAADSLSSAARAAVRQRLAQWLDAHLRTRMRPLRRLQAAGLDGPGRGLAFLLVEGLGNVRTAAARAVLNGLGAADRAHLTRLGVRFGTRHVYLPAMLKPGAVELRARLWSVHHRAPGLAPPPSGAPDPGRIGPAAGLRRSDRLRGASAPSASGSTCSSGWRRACARSPARVRSPSSRSFWR